MPRSVRGRHRGLPAFRTAALLVLSVAAGGGSSLAQEAPAWETGGGVACQGAVGLGGTAPFQTDSRGAPLTVFTAESELARSVGWQAVVGRRVAGRWQVEAVVSVQPTRISTDVADDFEGAEPMTATSPLTHLRVEGGVRWAPRRWGLTSRTQLFLAGGGGYVRHLHAGRTFIVSGRSFYAGGGVLQSMWQGSRGMRVGARLDGRLVGLSRGLSFDDRVHVTPAFGAGVFVQF